MMPMDTIRHTPNSMDDSAISPGVEIGLPNPIAYNIAALLSSSAYFLLVYLVLELSAFADEKIFGDAELTSPGENLTFNLGSHLVGTNLQVELTITNKTGKNFSVRVRPSCACTQISNDTLSAAPDGQIVFKNKIMLPSEARKFGTTLECVDEQNGISFGVTLVAECKSRVEISPKTLAFHSKTAPNTFQIRVTANGDQYRVEKVSLLNARLARVIASEYSERGAILSIECDAPSSDERKLELSFSVDTMDLSLKEVKTSQELITIEYTDRLRLGPSRPAINVSCSKALLPIYVITSQDNIKVEQASLSFEDSDKTLILLVSDVKRRAGVLMITLEATREKWDEFTSEQSIESCLLNMFFSNETRSAVKVSVSYVSNKKE
jgi:hypothetical protein